MSKPSIEIDCRLCTKCKKQDWTIRAIILFFTYQTVPYYFFISIHLLAQVRDKLSLKQLAGIVNLFSKNVHDSDLTPSMQNMACKILINIVDFINKKSEKETAYTGRELMMRMLEVVILVKYFLVLF